MMHLSKCFHPSQLCITDTKPIHCKTSPTPLSCPPSLMCLPLVVCTLPWWVGFKPRQAFESWKCIFFFCLSYKSGWPKVRFCNCAQMTPCFDSGWTFLNFKLNVWSKWKNVSHHLCIRINIVKWHHPQVPTSNGSWVIAKNGIDQSEERRPKL